MGTERFALAVARWSLGLLPTDEQPGVASDALEDGLDSPALRRLAGASASEVEEATFVRVTAELGIAPPAPRDAAFRIAQAVSREIVAGAVPPCEGAHRIREAFRLAAARDVDLGHALDPFVSWADECDYGQIDRAHCERAIRTAAAELASRSG